MNQYLNTPVRRRLAGWAVAATFAASLAACGGSDGEGSGPIVTTPPAPPPPPASVPASAVASVAAFVSYLNTLVFNENQEPLLADAVTPPTNDTDEPTAI